MAGLRGEETIAELCRQEGFAQSQYYSWSKEFMEARKKRLAGDTMREANTDEVKGLRKPRLLSDNGASYISDELAEWLDDKGMDHMRGAPYHPQTQGKIERWHQTLKNRILLENYFLPGDLKRQIGKFITHYNHHRYHESLQNLTPADVYFGRGHQILQLRKRIKKNTINQRRLQNLKQVA